MRPTHSGVLNGTAATASCVLVLQQKLAAERAPFSCRNFCAARYRGTAFAEKRARVRLVRVHDADVDDIIKRKILYNYSRICI